MGCSAVKYVKAQAWTLHALLLPQAKAATPLPTLEEAAAICAAGLTEMLVAFVYERVEASAKGWSVGVFMCV